jgi:hypothetical protein
LFACEEGEILQIKETSSVKLVVDGVVVDKTFHDANDAWEKAVNHIMQGKQKAVITEVITIEKT